MTISCTRAAIGKHLAVLLSPFFLCFDAPASQVIIETSAPTKTAVVAWNPVTNAAGYAIYYGTNSLDIGTRIDFGTNTTGSVSNLNAGQTYYFSVADYNAQGVQSALSAPVPLVITGVVRLQQAAPNNMFVMFPVMPPHWYSIQASTNLSSWTTISTTGTVTTNAWMYFNDTNILRCRFYRLCEH